MSYIATLESSSKGGIIKINERGVIENDMDRIKRKFNLIN